ncbi:hypothetical protein FS749_011905, partial [Ceratobasidium sp. UAMH 11750]
TRPLLGHIPHAPQPTSLGKPRYKSLGKHTHTQVGLASNAGTPAADHSSLAVPRWPSGGHVS